LSDEQNRGNYPRFKARVPVEFNPQGRRALASATADLSIRGLLFKNNVHISYRDGVVVTQDIKIGMDSSLSRCCLRTRKHLIESALNTHRLRSHDSTHPAYP
jgi:hypothetical protein